MKILYNQSLSSELSSGLLSSLGIQRCYLKYLFTEQDSHHITLKLHYHTDYEIHIIESGSLTYEIDGHHHTLNSGHFILLPPRKLHRVVHRSPQAATISITFHIEQLGKSLPAAAHFFLGTLSTRMKEDIRQIMHEYNQPDGISDRIIAGNISELLILLWRTCGMLHIPAVKHLIDEDPRLTLAKQYISDNIEHAPTVPDVASYCHLSTRQLTRLFTRSEDISPAAYIQKQRIDHIEMLLKLRELSLRAISEKMNFSSEYYFHAFFKKHAGMTPGEFRNMYS